MPRYDRLSPLESGFLRRESPTEQMHVLTLSFFEDTGRSDRELIRYVASKLPLVPRYRQRLVRVPFDQGRPVWVDDAHFEIENHVIFLNAPCANEGEVLELASRVVERPLDRRRPLWEAWFLRVADGRLALLVKSHHCVVGETGLDIGTALMSLTPEAAETPLVAWTPASEPSAGSLLSDALRERITVRRELIRSARAATRPGRRVFDWSRSLGRLMLSRSDVDEGPATAFASTPPGTAHRLEVARVALCRVKVVKDHFRCTVNDAILAILGGALRTLLRSREPGVALTPLRVLVPFGIRSDSENPDDDAIRWRETPLPIAVDAPEARLRIISSSLKDVRESDETVRATYWSTRSRYAPPTALARTAREMSKQKACDVVFVNVPGPQFPLFCCACKMADTFPFLPLHAKASLAISAVSYDGQLNFGLVANAERFSDLKTLARAIPEALEELLALTPRAEPPSHDVRRARTSPDVTNAPAIKRDATNVRLPRATNTSFG